MIEKYIPEFLDILYKEDVNRFIDINEVRDAFHSNQIKSKKQAIAAFGTLTPNNVLYVGAWIGLLTYYLMKEYPEIKFNELDIDYRCTIFNRYFSQVPHYTADVTTFKKINEFDTIINLSCEHMSDQWFDNLQPGTQVVLQSNNMKMSDHINCCETLEEMKQKYNLTEITYATTLKLNVYNRFTLAGIK